MATYLSFTDEQKQFLIDIQNDIIELHGKNCKLFYTPVSVACSNCVVDTIGQKSTNYYLHGGPLPFENGTNCPMCDGAGYHSEEQTEIVKMLIAWQPRNFYFPVPTLIIRMPAGIIQTKCSINYWPNIQRTISLVAQTEIAGYINLRYKLISEPNDVYSLAQGSFIICTWERAG